MKFIKVIFVVLIIAIIGGIFGKIYLKNKNQNIKVTYYPNSISPIYRVLLIPEISALNWMILKIEIML